MGLPHRITGNTFICLRTVIRTPQNNYSVDFRIIRQTVNLKKYIYPILPYGEVPIQPAMMYEEIIINLQGAENHLHVFDTMNEMHNFICLLYGSNQLRLELADQALPERFVSKARRLSEKIGTPVTEAWIKNCLISPGRLGSRKLPEDMAGWFPGRIKWESGSPLLEWVYLGNRSLVEPFYDDTIYRHRGKPINLLLGFTTPLDCLERLQVQNPVSPAGFIFHVSRCGSTLVSQMLAAVEANRVVSESTAIDAVLRSHFQNPSVRLAQKRRWLKKLVAVFGHRRDMDNRALFIKFDAWHIMVLPFIHRIFPDVPILFLYRDPVEVMVSHRKRPGSHMVPGLIPAEWFGASQRDIRDLSIEAYGSWVLDRLFRAAREHAQTVPFTVMNYNRLPSALLSPEINPFGAVFEPGDIWKMRAATQFYSKNPNRVHTADSCEKQAMAGPQLRSLVEGALWDAYEALHAYETLKIGRT